MSKNNSRNDLSPQIVSLSHIGGRSTQQDKLSPSPDEPISFSFDGQSDLLLVVADGAGGHQGGEVASRIAIETIVERYGTLRQQQKPKQALVNAIRDAHETIQDHQVADFEKQNMASTVVALLLTPLSKRKGKPAYEICVANVGDSRAYRYRPKLPLKQLSQDHTLVQEEVRQERLTPEQAKIHPLRHRLSQALGSKKELNIFTKAVNRVKKHDRYLLCTDGLTDVLDDAQIQTILSEPAPTKQVAESLMKEALVHAKDNVSFILLDMIPVTPDKRPLLAMSMIQSCLGKIGVGLALMIVLMIVFTVTMLLAQFSNWPFFAFSPPTASVNDESLVINNETRASPTQISQQLVVQSRSNQPSAQPSATQTTQPTHTASPTVTPEPTATSEPTATPEPILPFNGHIVGNAATAVPSPTSTPQNQIVEYRTGPDRIVFESMVGWGGQNRVCKGASSLIAIEQRLNYPYKHAIRPVGRPTVEQRGSDIYVEFDAIATKPRACGLTRYHEQVIKPNAQEDQWIIKNARLTKKVIAIHSNPEISQGGWVIYLEWR